MATDLIFRSTPLSSTWTTVISPSAPEVMAFHAQPPFDVIKVIETGPITNHVNFVRDRRGKRAYVTVGGLGLLKVFRTDDFRQIATIPLGSLPHGLWPRRWPSSGPRRMMPTPHR